MDSEHFRSIIETRMAALRQLHEDAAEGTAPVELDQTRVGRLSRMDALQQQAMNLESERRRERELIALGAALKRIDQDEFGDCEICDEAINPARLEIDPTATLCIECAGKVESR